MTLDPTANYRPYHVILEEEAGSTPAADDDRSEVAGRDDTSSGWVQGFTLTQITRDLAKHPLKIGSTWTEVPTLHLLLLDLTDRTLHFVAYLGTVAERVDVELEVLLDVPGSGSVVVAKRTLGNQDRDSSLLFIAGACSPPPDPSNSRVSLKLRWRYINGNPAGGVAIDSGIACLIGRVFDNTSTQQRAVRFLSKSAWLPEDSSIPSKQAVVPGFGSGVDLPSMGSDCNVELLYFGGDFVAPVSLVSPQSGIKTQLGDDQSNPGAFATTIIHPKAKAICNAGGSGSFASPGAVFPSWEAAHVSSAEMLGTSHVTLLAAIEDSTVAANKGQRLKILTGTTSSKAEIPTTWTPVDGLSSGVEISAGNQAVAVQYTLFAGCVPANSSSYLAYLRVYFESAAGKQYVSSESGGVYGGPLWLTGVTYLSPNMKGKLIPAWRADYKQNVLPSLSVSFSALVGDS